MTLDLGIVSCVFQSHIGKLEHEKNALLEVMHCIKSLQSVLRCRAQAGFMPLYVMLPRELLTKFHRNGLDDRCDAFSVRK